PDMWHHGPQSCDNSFIFGEMFLLKVQGLEEADIDAECGIWIEAKLILVLSNINLVNGAIIFETKYDS
ncbi:Centrosomal protein of 85 kDa, partial [Clarias magur]